MYGLMVYDSWFMVNAVCFMSYVLSSMVHCFWCMVHDPGVIEVMSRWSSTQAMGLTTEPRRRAYRLALKRHSNVDSPHES